MTMTANFVFRLFFILLYSYYSVRGLNNNFKQPQTSQYAIKSNLLKLLTGAAVVAAVPNAITARGVKSNGLFDLCPEPRLLNSCVSSQDDRPQFFLPPWTYDGHYEDAREGLLRVLLQSPGAVIQKRSEDDDRYISVDFRNVDGSVDEAEFYFTPNDSTVQFRSMRRGNDFDFGVNRKRIESLRIQLRFESVPVIRNRRRALLFIESPLDEFGPPTVMFDSVIDEMSGDMGATTNGVMGLLDPSSPLWETPKAIRR